MLFFVVFIEGKDSASENVSSTIDSVEISTALQAEDFVSIKLQSDTESYTQFAQIYQLVPVPSIFFIGSNGVPLEIVAGEVTSQSLANTINTVLQKFGKNPQTGSEVPLVSPVPETLQTTSAKSGSQAFLDDARSANPQQNDNEQSSSNDADNLSAQERIDRAKDIIEKKKALKKFEEEQNEKEKEMERRKVGQDVQKMKRWQHEEELKQLKEERQREKAEEQAARERILKQIAEDRAERAAKFNEDKNIEEMKRKEKEELKRKALEEQRSQEAVNSNTAKIQFRFPEGHTLTKEFPAETLFSEVYAFIMSQPNFSLRNFSMSTTFPRRMFTESDYSQNLRDLQLVPSAVILILPISGSNAVRSFSERSAISNFLWTLISPVFAVFNYFRRMIFGSRGNGNTTGSDPKSSDDSTSESRGSKDAKKSSSAGTFSKEGNIHRLSNQRDSDDENNTWNGNSTQQM